MGVLYFLAGGGFLTMFLGFIFATEGENGQGDSDLSTLLKFIGIFVMVVGFLGMAALSSHRRQKERKEGKRELARQGSAISR